ncbi:MAG: adenosylmethionine decarboxylase [Desulfomicrobiaceae bacterium]|nr:adenosylmethionine decarboxylase [Desulfomicrobiaceae bacterium]
MARGPLDTAQPKKAQPGIHLIGDLYDCLGDTRYFYDKQALRALCLHAVKGSGLTAVGDLFHQFGADGGVTGAVILAESHLAIHTWPEKRYVTLDVYVCNYSQDNREKAQQLFHHIVETFAPKSPRIQCVDRE